MKDKLKSLSLTCLVLAVCGLAAWLSWPPPAHAQFVGQTPGLVSVFTNVMPVTTSATTNVLGPAVITLRNNQGLGLTFKVGTTNAVNASASNIGVGLAVTPDGTNYTTNPYVWLVGSVNATGATVFSTNFPATILNNFQYAKVITVTNQHTNTFWFTNGIASYF
jgi:hypothetical protein